MKKILFLVFTLFSLFVLAGCQEEPIPGERGGGTRYVYKYNYEDYKELCDNSKDCYHADGRDLTEPIPDYQFEGVVKKVYEVATICSCTKEERPDDNISNCPNYRYNNVTIYWYTDENNAFRLSFYEPMNLNFWIYSDLQLFEHVNGVPHYMAQSVGGGRSLRYIFDAFQTTEKQTFFINDSSYGTYTADYTEEEIKYWFDLTFNTMKEYHLAEEGKK